MTNTDLPLAILFSFITALSNGFGFYLQKKGLSEMNTEGLSFIKFMLAAIKNKKWLIGFLCIVLRIPLYVIAINIGSLSVTQPIANTGIVIIVFLGMKYMHEKLGKLEIMGVCLIFAGIILISVTPDIGITVTPTNDQVVQGLVILAVIMACLYGVSIVLLFLKKKAISLSVIAGLSMGIAAILIRALSITLKNDTNKGFLDFDIDIKVVFGIVRNELVLESLFAWGAAVFLILYFASEIPAVNSGKITFVIPTLMGISFILPVFAGFLIFLEPALPMLVVGIIACLVGVLILSRVQATMETKFKQKPEETTAPAQANALENDS
jgi:uncharacterized membrane protein